MTKRLTFKAEHLGKELGLLPEDICQDGHLDRPMMHFHKQPPISDSDSAVAPASSHSTREEAREARLEVTTLNLPNFY